jgi:putative heme transporter
MRRGRKQQPTENGAPTGDGAPAADGAEPPELALHDLTGLFRAPHWLRELGLMAWLAVGVTLAVIGAIWLLSLTQTIVMPVITAGVVAAVSSPLLRRLVRLGLPRGLASALMLLALIVAGGAVVAIVLGGIIGQADALRGQLGDAKETLAGWLTDLGVDRETAQAAKDDASAAVGDAVPALLEGVGEGLKSLSSLVVFLSLTALSLFFLLKDGPFIRRWAESHTRMPQPVAHRMGDRLLQSLRGYFLGVTFVALFNAIVVGAGALALDVPLAGTIMAVTFFGAYVPYLGAWGAGAFSVLVSLGGAGPDAALAMIVIQLLANGLLQQMIQPIAYGAALGIHPLAVLIVTIAGGSLFGAVGLILAAPLTAAATGIASDLARAREASGQGDVAHDAPPASPGFDVPATPAMK